MLALATRCCVCIYDVEKLSAPLENAAGFAKLDAYIRRHDSDVYLGMFPIQNGGSYLMY